MNLVFDIHQNTSTASTRVEITQCIVAGWAGRSAEQIQAHIEELALLGVAPPSTVPLYYQVAANQLTQSGTIQVVGEHTSGEAEVLFFATDGHAYISLASDHTDRRLESHSVALSKQICVKPVAREAWRHADVAGHWDQLILRSWIEENGVQVLYQNDTLDTLQLPGALASRHFATTVPSAGAVMLCGTVPVIGDIRPSARFTMELEDPVLGRSLRHSYDVQMLSVVE